MFVYGVQFARLTCYFSLPPITALGCQEHEEEKRRKTCFLPDTVIHEASDLPHVSPPAILSTTRLLTADHPRLLRPPNNWRAPRTSRDRRTMYSHTGQYDHTLSRNSKTVIHNRSTRNTLLRTFPYGCNLNMVIYCFIMAWIGMFKET